MLYPPTMTSNALPSNMPSNAQVETPESLLVVDDYTIHKEERFTKRVETMNSRQETVKGGMSCLCNPGDVIINKIIQAKSKNKYIAWVMQQPLCEDGTPPMPSRAQSATWAAYVSNVDPLTPSYIHTGSLHHIT